MTLRSAFSMVELSFVIAIISLLTVGGLTVGVSVVDQKRHAETRLQLQEITDALRVFYQVNQRLPCPAPMNAAIDAADFGQEINAGACATNTATPGATTRVSVGSGRFVRSGGVPVRALGLKESMARDEWYNRFTYVVLEEATDDTELATTLDAFRLNDALNGVQMVTSTGATIYNQALFALIGHGPDGKGAYRHKTGSLSFTCNDGSGADDIENCTHSNALVVDAPLNDGEMATNFFDDYVSWGGRMMMQSSFEDDPQVGTLSDGMLCVANSGQVVCNTTEDDPQVSGGTSGRFCTWNGSAVVCNTTISETDPQVSGGTAGRLCTWNGSAVVCNTNNVASFYTETDPQIGNISTSGNWCRSDGSQVICDQSAPSGGGAVTYVKTSNTSGHPPVYVPQLEHTTTATSGSFVAVVRNSPTSNNDSLTAHGMPNLWYNTRLNHFGTDVRITIHGSWRGGGGTLRIRWNGLGGYSGEQLLAGSFLRVIDN